MLAFFLQGGGGASTAGAFEVIRDMYRALPGYVAGQEIAGTIVDCAFLAFILGIISIVRFFVARRRRQRALQVA